MSQIDLKWNSLYRIANTSIRKLSWRSWRLNIHKKPTLCFVISRQNGEWYPLSSNCEVGKEPFSLVSAIVKISTLPFIIFLKFSNLFLTELMLRYAKFKWEGLLDFKSNKIWSISLDKLRWVIQFYGCSLNVNNGT